MTEADLALSALTEFAAGDKVRYLDGRTARVLAVKGPRLFIQWLRPIGWPRRSLPPVHVMRHNVTLCHD